MKERNMGGRGPSTTTYPTGTGRKKYNAKDCQ
jgi:hypothetical protein